MLGSFFRKIFICTSFSSVDLSFIMCTRPSGWSPAPTLGCSVSGFPSILTLPTPLTLQLSSLIGNMVILQQALNITATKSRSYFSFLAWNDNAAELSGVCEPLAQTSSPQLWGQQISKNCTWMNRCGSLPKPLTISISCWCKGGLPVWYL